MQNQYIQRLPVGRVGCRLSTPLPFPIHLDPFPRLGSAVDLFFSPNHGDGWTDGRRRAGDGGERGVSAAARRCSGGVLLTRIKSTTSNLSARCARPLLYLVPFPVPLSRSETTATATNSLLIPAPPPSTLALPGYRYCCQMVKLKARSSNSFCAVPSLFPGVALSVSSVEGGKRGHERTSLNGTHNLCS